MCCCRVCFAVVRTIAKIHSATHNSARISDARITHEFERKNHPNLSMSCAFVAWMPAQVNVSTRRRSRHSSARRVWRVCGNVGSIGSGGEELTNRLNSEDQRVVLPLLATLNGTTAAVSLRTSNALTSPNRAIRAAAHAALGRVGNKSDANYLITVLLSNDDTSVRASSAAALGELKEGVSTLSKTALDLAEPYIVRYSCIVALGAFNGDVPIDALIVVDATPLEIAGAVSALTDITHSWHDERVLKYVKKHSLHVDDLVRGAVARAYGVWARSNGPTDYFRSQLHEMLTREEVSFNSPHVRNLLAQAVLPDEFVNDDSLR